MEQITLIGNVGRDPQFRTSSNGKEYMMFSLACSVGERTQWYGVAAPPLQKIAPYIVKGKQLMVQGRPSYSVYNGQVDVLVYADRIELLGGKKEAEDLITEEDAQKVYENQEV